MLRLPSKNRKSSPSKKRVPTPPATKGNMQVRVVTLAVMVGLVFVLLGTRLWYLQVLAGPELADDAQQTHTRVVSVPAQRGVIYDRNGKVLANNVPGLNITIIPDEISRDKVKKLAKVLKADVDGVMERYDAAVDPATGNRYASMLLKENADRDAVTYVSERTEEFPSVRVNDDYIRNYPKSSLAAHVLGYTGAVTPEELKQKGSESLSNDAVIGKGGVELWYEQELSGKPGKQEYNVDSLGRVQALRRADGSRADGKAEISPELGQPDSVTDPVPGKNLSLTLDMDLQKQAEEELDAGIARAQQEGYSGEGGAVIAMDPRNGEILAMASRPTFDPQLFVGGISGKDEVKTFKYLNSEYANSPFTNRAIVGAYPGASTFKVFTGLAGFAYGVINAATTVTDNGGCFEPTGTTGGCWYSWRQSYGTGSTHGTQNYSQAIADSNDKFFYQVADWLWQKTNDVDWLPKFYEKFGFGSLTGIDLPGETKGTVPTSSWEKWYAEKVAGNPEEQQWTISDWINLSIGQGDLQISPIQMAQAYSAIENNGTLVTPHVAKAILGQNGKVDEKISPKPESKVDFDPSARYALIDGLRGVTGPDGTAAPAFTDSKLPIVGKSGTGERAGKDPVNWFAGWAENQKNPLVVVVMVEGGGHSEVTAAPAVRNILEDYYGVKGATKPQAADSGLVSTYAGTPAQ